MTDRKIVDYILVYGDLSHFYSPEENLYHEVNNAMKKGYQPFGSPIKYLKRLSLYDYRLTQAMVKYEEK